MAGGFPQLTELRAESAGLTDIPPSVCALPRLRELHLRSNRISTLPGPVGADLRYLNLRDNQLTVIPEGLAGLPRLRELDLRQNHIAVLPPFLLELPALDKLDLRWNQVPEDDPTVHVLRDRGCLIHV